MSQQASTDQSTASSSRRTRIIVLVLLALLILFHLGNNWLWRASSEIVYGFDRMFHQVSSLAYYEILRDGPTPQALFAALTWSDYYPPLVHLGAVIFYALLGVSMDAAALSNSLYVVIFILALYGLGERLGGPWAGLLSAFVTSMLPIVFSMSRYLYIDYALTALVAANVCLLVRSDRFARKGYALLYGLSLGLGMLTKWTFIAFTAAPLLVVLASPDLARSAWRALRPAAWDRRRLLAAALLGLGLTALWFVPNIEATASLPLGYALVVLSWLLWSGTWYFVLAPPVVRHSSPPSGANLLAALGLGISVASSWYLTKINFFETFWLNAYGKPTGRSWGFQRYLEFLYREQLSALFAVLLVVAVAGLIWSRWRRTRSWRGMLALGVEGRVLVVWAIVPFVIFSSRVSIVHSRYIMPLLPPLGIAISLWLVRLQPRWLRGLTIALVVAAALFQFSALSYDALAGVREKVPLLADGLSIQLPSSGRTDADYWVVPDILEYVEEQRQGDSAGLGVLVNEYQVNSKHFIYLAYAEHPGVEIQELTTLGWTPPVYPRLFESEFVLALDPPPDYARRPATVATLKRLLDTPHDTFHRAYDLVETYPLPDGRRLLLYQRRYALPEETDLVYYEALMADLGQVARPEDAVIAIPAQQIYALARFGDGSLGLHPLPEGEAALSGADLEALARLGEEHDRLWLVLGDVAQADPSGLLAPWLAQRFYRAHDAWYGPLQLVLYAPGSETDSEVPYVSSTATWENGITLQGYRFLEPSAAPGQILRLELLWQAAEPIPERYKVFVHVLNQEGQVVAQRDSEPVSGTRPTTTWEPGEPIADRYGLWLPAGLPAGDYRIVTGLYHAESGDRVPACCPEGDTVILGGLQVEGDTVRILAPDGN